MLGGVVGYQNTPVPHVAFLRVFHDTSSVCYPPHAGLIVAAGSRIPGPDRGRSPEPPPFDTTPRGLSHVNAAPKKSGGISPEEIGSADVVGADGVAEDLR